MTRRLVLIWPALALLARQRKGRNPKPPQLEVLELKGRRTTEGVVEIDGRLRNCGEKALQKVKLLFHILAPGQQVISTQTGAIDEEVLEPGEETEFHWQMRDHARAVKFRLAATDRGDNDLLVDKPGPYPIE